MNNNERRFMIMFLFAFNALGWTFLFGNWQAGIGWGVAFLMVHWYMPKHRTRRLEK